MELSDLRSTIENMSDEELQLILKDVRTNRRTSKPRAETSSNKPAKKQESTMGLDAMLKAAQANPAIAAQLLAALQGRKKE